MARDGTPIPSPDKDKSPDAAEAWLLIDALLEGRLSDHDRLRLEQLVVEQPAIARMYLRVVHFWCSLPLHVGKVQNFGVMLEEPDEDENADPSSTLAETMIMPAIRGIEKLAIENSEQETFEDVSSYSMQAPVQQPTSRLFTLQTLKKGGMAAAIAITLGIAIWAVWPKRPAAILTATAAAILDGSASTAPGSKLASGRSFVLNQGAVELTFDSGAVVVLSAPARFQVVDRNTLVLDAGLLAAHVPPRAVGFRVVSPNLSIVDRGTDFGVRTTEADSATEVAVFTGKIDASAVDAGHNSVGGDVRVTAEHAVRSNGSDSHLVDAPYVPEIFPRDIAAIQMSLNWHGTGAGLSSGMQDSFWQIVSVPNDPDWVPHGAVVVQHLSPRYPVNFPDGQWIGTSSNAGFAYGGETIYRTSVDITGYNPSTATIVAQLAVDEGIVDIRVNGVFVTGHSFLTDDPDGPVTASQLALPAKYFRAGANQVDIIIRNLPEAMPEGNYAGLQLSWKATAFPIVRQ